MTITDEPGVAASLPRDAATKDRADERAISEMWLRFWAKRELALRNKLLLTYEPLVRRTVARLPASIRSNADADDLCSFGRLGLIDAIEKCDSNVELSRFPAYAAYRIRGAIIDELRRIDWVPRTIRRRVIDYRSTVDQLSNELGRTPCDAEVFASMNIDDKGGFDVLRDVAASHLTHLPAPWLEGDSLGTGGAGGEAALDARGDPVDHLLASERAEALRGAIAQLTPRQQLVIGRRYMAGQTQREIASSLGVTTARVCQIEAAAIRGLRAILCGGDTEDETENRPEEGPRRLGVRPASLSA